MGIFSFLKKKNGAAGAQGGEQTHADAGSERERQRDIARATVAKIDRIELEMASAIFDGDAWSGGRSAPAAASAAASTDASRPDMDVPELTDMLHDAPEAAAPSRAPAVEEAAILHADGQDAAAEQVLLASLPDTGRSERLPWRMLLDLYQIAGREQDFESIAIDYASRFDTSPPAYQTPAGVSGAPDAGASFAGPTPTATLNGVLDDSIAGALARLQAPSPSPVVRIECGGVTGATAQGCAVLLATLQPLRHAGRELVLAGVDGLTAVLRPMLTVGDRGAGQAPWLLMLELLLLTNREKAFEELAMDYCITFEVSPPSFERPVRAALSLTAGPAVDGDRFLLPPMVGSGDAAALAPLLALEAHAARPGPLIIDCSRLARIDYAAANALGERLRALAADGTPSGRRIELRDLNHLVAALLGLLGIGAYARLTTRK